jgi:hypothetical protein
MIKIIFSTYPSWISTFWCFINEAYVLICSVKHVLLLAIVSTIKFVASSLHWLLDLAIIHLPARAHQIRIQSIGRVRLPVHVEVHEIVHMRHAAIIGLITSWAVFTFDVMFQSS